MAIDKVDQVLRQAGCQGWVCALEVDGAGEACHDADEPVVTASVYKVAVALEVFRQAAAGRLDPARRLRLAPGGRTPGPTGISVFADEAEVSVRDLALLMLSVSDNAATDALTDLVGLDAINATLRGLGLERTVIPARLGDVLDWMGQDAGYRDYQDLSQADLPPEREAEVMRRIIAGRGLDPFATIRSTAREIALLLRLIWRDEAGPASACAEVRRLMALQVTRQRIALGFPRHGVRVAAKSGTYFGLIRNEAAVISYPSSLRYAVAVFTRARAQWKGEHEINRAIGQAAALAVECLRPPGS
jgi:beta-lactamase class A